MLSILYMDELAAMTYDSYYSVLDAEVHGEISDEMFSAWVYAKK